MFLRGLFCLKSLHMQSIENLLQQDYIAIAIWALMLNLGLLLLSLSLYGVWHSVKRNHVKVNDCQPIVASDLWAAASTWICNAVVFVFGAFLWKQGYLVVDFRSGQLRLILGQIVLLIIIIDLLMYCFHKLAHHKLLYALIHQKHHQHIGVNALSLFVLSPFEAIGFGIMLLVLVLLYPFHYIAVGGYLVINVLWGTVGHFNKVRKRGGKGWTRWLGTASFHNDHHLVPHANFGFYTTFWDRLFRTFLKKA